MRISATRPAKDEECRRCQWKCLPSTPTWNEANDPNTAFEIIKPCAGFASKNDRQRLLGFCIHRPLISRSDSWTVNAINASEVAFFYMLFKIGSKHIQRLPPLHVDPNIEKRQNPIEFLFPWRSFLFENLKMCGLFSNKLQSCAVIFTTNHVFRIDSSERAAPTLISEYLSISSILTIITMLHLALHGLFNIISNES